MSAAPAMADVRSGRMRCVLGTGKARTGGLVPVTAAVTMSPATRLTRRLLVPEGAVQRFHMGTPFLWTPEGGEAVVLAVGVADVAELSAALSGGATG